jgi:flavodoxin
MNALILYDSTYGNTESIATAIAEALAERGTVGLMRVSKAQATDLEGTDLLLLGCPTQRRRPTDAIRAFLGTLPRSTLNRIRVAAFDTRYRKPRLITGSAATAIAKGLRKAGASLLVPAESFFVMGREGPLEEGELERAAEWARELLHRLEA